MAGIFRREVALRATGQLPADESLADLFHENTKLQRATITTAVGPESYSARELEAMARAYKRYRLHPQVPLPRPSRDTSGPPLGEVIASRRSRRSFASDELELTELAAIMQWSYGITGEVGIRGGGVQRFRASPSAGALYPAEIYLGVRGVRGLEPGIYHYEVPETSLALLSRGDPTDRLYEVCCRQDYARQAAIVVLISAVIERTKRKYGDRGYRYVLLDVGHLGQNLYLACTALGLAIVTTCGFFDDEAADTLGIDGCDEAVLYVAFIGRPGAAPPSDFGPSARVE
jgi:SagB-type dehydrogenase family enzyme